MDYFRVADYTLKWTEFTALTGMQSFLRVARIQEQSGTTRAGLQALGGYSRAIERGNR